MQLSQHFNLSEFTFSDWAERNDFEIVPTEQEIASLTKLCKDVLEPLRRKLAAPIVISSGLRPEAVNKGIGGSENSDHKYGRAADIRVIGYRPLLVAQTIEIEQYPIKQCIHEFGRWVHVSIDLPGVDPKLEYLTAFRANNQTHYMRGIRSVDAAKEAMFA